VILIITEAYSAQYLQQNEIIWQRYFSPAYKTSYIDRKWYKVVAHSVPTKIFNYPGGMELLKQEIKTFNLGFNPIAVNWLSSQTNRAAKHHGSVVISFGTEEIATRALSQRLMVAGMPIRTAPFEESMSGL
jgi:hypothetical protein